MASAENKAQLLKVDKKLIVHVAQRTLLYPYRLWGFGESIAMDALLEASRKTGQPDFANFVFRNLDLWIYESSQIAHNDHVAPGIALLDLYEQGKEERFLHRSKALAEHLVSAPRSGSGTHLHQPDENHWVWVDCIYTDGPFLARLANVTGQKEYRRAAVEYALRYTEALADGSDGLFYHGRDEKSRRTSPYYWGRGNGWALLGLVDLLIELPRQIDGRQQIEEDLHRLVDRLVELQDTSGDWHTILDCPESYLEPSVGAMFVYGVQKAINRKILVPSYQEKVDLAWSAVQKNMKKGGRFPVSEATAVGDFNYYNGLALGIYPWGQGPFLLAICQRM